MILREIETNTVGELGAEFRAGGDDYVRLPSEKSDEFELIHREGRKFGKQVASALGNCAGNIKIFKQCDEVVPDALMRFGSVF